MEVLFLKELRVLSACLCLGASLALSKTAFAADEELALDTSYASNHSRPLLWKEIFQGDERAIYIGEDHHDEFAKAEIALHMAEMRADGITHIAIEGWKENVQPVIDAYFRGEINKDELLRTSGIGPIATLSDHQKNLIHLVDAAKSAGLGVIAPDISDAEEDDRARLCAREPPSAECEGFENGNDVRYRDLRMAANHLI